VEHIGMDVHKRESQLCIVTEQGSALLAAERPGHRA
jgi:hypothetical protein